MTRRRLELALALLLLGLPGCLTAAVAHEWRDDPDPDSREVHLEALLDSLEEPGERDERTLTHVQDAATVITLALEEAGDDPADDDDPAARRAAARARLRAALRAAALDPRVESSGDPMRCRGWALHCLGRLSDPADTPFLVERVGAPVTDRFAVYPHAVDEAALGALAARTPEVLADPALRLRLARVVHELTAAPEGTDELRRLLGWFRRELRTVQSSVELLKDARAQRPQRDAHLSMLGAAYSALDEALRGPSSPAVRTETVALARLLLVEAEDQDARVARRARSILVELAPYTYALHLVERLRDRAVQRATVEDLVWFLPTLEALAAAYAAAPAADPPPAAFVHEGRPRLHEGALVAGAPFARLREEVLAGALAFCAAHPSADDREFTYQTLFAYDPVLLARHLAGAAPVTVDGRGAGEAEATQHARYLALLLEAAPVARDAALTRQVTAALAHLVNADVDAVRRLVAGALAARDPTLLIQETSAVMRRLGRLPADRARVALATYLTALAALERTPGGMRAFPVDDDALPFGVLAAALERPEEELRGLALQFLLRRDPGVALLRLTDRLRGRLDRDEELEPQFLTAVCDVLLTQPRGGEEPALDPSAVDECVRLLHRALPGADPGLALHLLRAIGESGASAAPELLRAVRRSKLGEVPDVRAAVDALLIGSGARGAATGEGE